MYAPSMLLPLLLPMAWALAPAAAAQEGPDQEPLAARLPAGSLAVVEIPDPAAATEAALRAIRPAIAALPEAQRTAASLGLLAVQAHLGMALPEAAGVLAGHGLALAFLPGPGGLQVLAVARPGDPERAARLLAGLPQPVPHRVEGDLLFAAGRQQALAWDPAGRSPEWLSPAEGTALARLFVDLDRLRELRPAFGSPERRLDPGARWLFAPLLAALPGAGRLQVEAGERDGLWLRGALDAGASSEPWTELLARGGAERAVPDVPGGAVLSLDRSLKTLLQNPERYLGDEPAVQIRAFTSVADQIVGHAATFAGDLLGGLREPIHLVALPAEGDDSGDDRSPPLLFPAVALVAEVAQPEVEDVLRRTAQVLAMLSNQERIRLGKDPFRVVAARGEGVRGLTSALPAWRGPGAPPAEQALTPTLLFGHGHVVLATTRRAAERVLAACGEQGRKVRGDLLSLSGSGLAAVIARNFGVLVAARILDEGEEPEQAREFWRVVESLVAPMDLELALHQDRSRTGLELRLSWRKR